MLFCKRQELKSEGGKRGPVPIYPCDSSWNEGPLRRLWPRPRDELEARDGGAKGRERLSLIVHCGTIKYIDYENISAEKKTFGPAAGW